MSNFNLYILKMENVSFIYAYHQNFDNFDNVVI